MIPENTPKGESQANGRAEESGKTIRGFARVLKSQIEESAHVTLNSGDPILLWLIRWSAMLPSRFLVGKDGRTAFERRRGRRCTTAVQRFGEQVWYKELKSKSEVSGKIESDWKEGVWLGHASG